MRRGGRSARRKAAEEARQVANFNRSLAQEVDHRVRNNLAGLLSLVSAMRGSARDVKSFAAAIEGRLLAMSHATSCWPRRIGGRSIFATW